MSTYIRGSGKTGRRNADEARFMASRGRFAVALPQWASDEITKMATKMGVTRCRLVCDWVIEKQGKETQNAKSEALK
jgi:hypothetical protein